MFKTIFIFTSLAVLLSACGGGSDIGPVVTSVQGMSLRFGQTATIYVGGQFLRSDMVADTGTCTNPGFGSSSSPNTAVLNCKVTATGALPVVIKAANGQVLFSTTLTVLQPQVTLFTSKGEIVMALNAAEVPTTVSNFLSYVSTGFYSSTLFHRVMAGFVVQGGGYTTGLVKKAGQLAPIVLESNKGLLNTRATVAMARTGAFDSATSEFYFNLVNNTALDFESAAKPGYAVFGTVLSGLDVVDAIATQPTTTFNGTPDVPVAEVTVNFALQTQ
jgi:cyclophilin family peptidyl-prolyl cis-trans isomerase